ncbi:MAG: OmpA family protein [Limisphaerales bacterium]
MNLIPSGRLLILSLVLTVAVAGCKHRPPPTTPLGHAGLTGDNTTPGSGNPIPGPGDGNVKDAPISGIPQGEGHPGWPEDAAALQAYTVHFAFDKSEIQAGERSKLSSVADFLKANAADAVKIEGHCDERGTEEYNRALGERRALALREALVGLGIDPSRVDTISYGKDRPEDSGHDAAAWAKNRRGVFILLTPPK